MEKAGGSGSRAAAVGDSQSESEQDSGNSSQNRDEEDVRYLGNRRSQVTIEVVPGNFGDASPKAGGLSQPKKTVTKSGKSGTSKSGPKPGSKKSDNSKCKNKKESTSRDEKRMLKALYDDPEDNSVTLGPPSKGMSNPDGRYNNWSTVLLNGKETNYICCNNEWCKSFLAKGSGFVTVKHNETCKMHMPPEASAPNAASGTQPVKLVTRRLGNKHLRKRFRYNFMHAVNKIPISHRQAASKTLLNLLESVSDLTMRVNHKIDVKECLPHRNTMPVITAEMFKQVKKEVKKMLQDKEVKSITIQTDHWSDRANRRNYMGVVASFLVPDPKKPGKKKFMKVILALKPVTSHDHMTTRNDLISVIEDYGIADKVRFIVSDGASSMVKAFNGLREGDSYARVLESLFQQSDSNEPIPDDAEPQESEDEDPNALPGEEQVLVMSSPEAADGPPQTKWVWCAAHVLQLAAYHAFKKLEKQNRLKTLLSKAKKIVFRMRKTAAGRSLAISLKNDINVRWDSKKAMVESVIHDKNREQLQGLKDKQEDLIQGYLEEVLRDSSVRVLRRFANIMKRVMEHRLILSSDEYPTLGLYAPAKVELLNDLKNMRDDILTPEPVQEFVDLLIQEINHRLVINEWHAVATILTPTLSDTRLRFLFQTLQETGTKNLTAEEKKKGVVVPNLYDRGCSLIRTWMKQIRERNNQVEADEPEETDGLSFLDEGSQSQEADELKFYLDAIKLKYGKNNEIVDWIETRKAEFPVLYEIIQMFMSCATSVACERLFSLAGLRIGPHNYRLKPESLEAQLLYWCNEDLIDAGVLNIYCPDETDVQAPDEEEGVEFMDVD